MIEVYTYKILNDIDVLEKEELVFTRAQYAATRGHSFKLHKRRFRLNVLAITFSNRVVNTLKKLPDNIINAPP